MFILRLMINFKDPQIRECASHPLVHSSILLVQGLNDFSTVPDKADTFCFIFVKTSIVLYANGQCFRLMSFLFFICRVIKLRLVKIFIVLVW